MMPILLHTSASSGRMWLDTMMVLPEFPKSLEQISHFDAGARIETAQRFVQQQHLRVVQQYSG